MSVRGESTAALMPKAAALSISAPMIDAYNVVRFMFVSRRVDRSVESRRVVVCDESVMMMDLEPRPICRRRRTLEGALSESGVRRFLLASGAAGEGFSP